MSETIEDLIEELRIAEGQVRNGDGAYAVHRDLLTALLYRVRVRLEQAPHAIAPWDRREVTR